MGITWFPGVTEGDQLWLITYKRRIYKGRINGKLIAHEGSEGRGGGFGGRHKSNLEPYGESGKCYRDKRQNPPFLHKRL